MNKYKKKQKTLALGLPQQQQFMFIGEVERFSLDTNTFLLGFQMQ